MMLWTVPLLPIVVGALIAPLGERPRGFLLAAALATLAGTALLAALAVAGGWTASLQWSDIIVLSAALTPLSSVVLLLVPLIALPVIGHAAALEDKRELTRMIGLLLIFTGGMELVVVADDLLTVLIGWEIIGACSWALISHKWWDIDNPRSGLYAFVMTRFGDLGLFAAVMALFAATGSFAFAGLAELDGAALLVVAFGLILSASSKAGQVPFSPWLFRAMAGPSSVSALLHAATLVAAGVYLLARLQPWLAEAPGFGATVITIGLVTALSGGVVAIVQNHAKRLLAASTSAQLGFMFVAVGAGYPMIAILHLVAHAAYKAPLFLSAGLAGEHTGSYRLDQMRLGRAAPVLAIVTGIAALALAGLPPMSGGWTKEEIIKAAGERDFWIAIAVILGGALSAAYATRFQLLAYGPGERDGQEGLAEEATRGEWLGIAVLGLYTLALSLLWLSPVSETVAEVLGFELPKGTTTELILSLLLLALGVLAGVYLVRRVPAIGTSGPSARAADWLGLPLVVEVLTVRPTDWLADVAARLDDRAVDKGVRMTAAMTEWFARVAGSIGEFFTDGLAEGTARLVGLSGRDLRRLQTGLSHHYYVIFVGGLAVAITFLAIGV